MTVAYLVAQKGDRVRVLRGRMIRQEGTVDDTWPDTSKPSVTGRTCNVWIDGGLYRIHADDLEVIS